MKIYGHIRKRDLDGIRNDKDAYRFGGVPIFYGSCSYRDDMEYINQIVNHIRMLFPEIQNSKMFVRKLTENDSENHNRNTMVYIMLDADTAIQRSSEYIVI